MLLRLPRPLKLGAVVLIDVFICGISVWLAFGLRLDQWVSFQEQQWLVFVVAIIFSLPLFIYFGLYRAISRYIGPSDFLVLKNIFIIYVFLFLLIFTFFQVDYVPRAIGVIQPILFFIGIGASRFLISYWLKGGCQIEKSVHYTKYVALIYGVGSAGRQLASNLANNNEMRLVGFVDDDYGLQGRTVNGIPVFSSAVVLELIRRFDVTDVLLAIPSVGHVRRSEIITSLNGCGVRVRTLPRFIDIALNRLKLSDLHDLDMNDLLGRAVVPPEIGLLKKNIYNQVVLVTGAGGSIGSELCRQIIKHSPKSLILVDSSEHSIYLILEELKKTLVRLEEVEVTCFKGGGKSPPHSAATIQLVPCLASVRDGDLLKKIFREHGPATVFHAAAYKHVPLVEQNVVQGIQNNVFGTLACAQVSLECGVSQFILVSTDKAVRPTNVMGASKRISELILQAMSDVSSGKKCSTIFSMVRFGNVLGSSGSVAPLFSSQIASGGPITLTHLQVTRYFMTIPEAAQLVIQASAMALGGDVFVLDMGEPIRIYDLATKMIFLSGLLIKDVDTPYGDIEIRVTGLRPGEKLYEELLIGDNPQPTLHPKIMKAQEEFMSWNDLQEKLKNLSNALDTGDDELIKSMLKEIVPGYQPKGDGFVSSDEIF